MAIAENVATNIKENKKFFCQLNKLATILAKNFFTSEIKTWKKKNSVVQILMF